MLHRRRFITLIPGAALAKTEQIDTLAERYTKLVLAVGLHDPDYVDAYYGPPAWKDEVARQKRSLADIQQEAGAVVGALEKLRPAGSDELVRLRHRYLLVQTKSLIARTEMLNGKRLSFDEESRALYDAVAPEVPESDLQKTLASLDKLVPGKGSLPERFAEWLKQFYIPAKLLPSVFQAAIDEARARTRRHIRLPANESFAVEYVNKQVWSAYNWYKGDAHSLIQVNTDLPVGIDFVLKLACHEGYPGHHVYNALLEDRLVRRRGWMEFSVYPLYSPQSLIAEGTADYGVELAFLIEERVAFLESVLFPRAGLDAAKARGYLQVVQLAGHLDHAVNMAARSYLNGEISRERCQKLLQTFALQSPDRAEQGIRFIEKNRTYVINYNVGEDLVRTYMNRRGSPGSDSKAWSEFEALLSSPRLPSGLISEAPPQ